MADAIIPLAIKRIGDLLVQEAAFLSGVREEVIRLQNELKRMQCFLKDADCWQDQDERVHNWIAEIRDVAYDSEDLLDTFLLKIVIARRGTFGIVNKLARAPSLHQMGNQIRSIRTRIGDISASMQTYGIRFEAEDDGEVQRRLRSAYPHVEEEHVINFDAITRDLKALLMKDEERVCVVSIVGMGGLGKTTLAKKVYNDIHLKKHFDSHSWAFISQQFSPRDVLARVLMEVVSPQAKPKLEDFSTSKFETKHFKAELVLRSLLEKMKEEELVEALRDALKEKRYLVVLDDIWNVQAWNSLKHAFPNGRKGSKVLFTTRNRDVASYADPWSTPLEPPFLSDDKGWELLRKIAFPRQVPIENYDELEYEELGKEMAKKCGGLPLAVAVLEVCWQQKCQ